MSPAEVRAAVEAEVREQLAVLASSAPRAALAGVEVLDERVAFAGEGFRPRRSFRILPARDGWLALSLPRESDRELVPALIRRSVDTTDPDVCWRGVATWLLRQPTAEAEKRGVALSLAMSRIPEGLPRTADRPPVLAEDVGGGRVTRGAPRVVDLSSLWAGPLAARTLGATGARVLKVESRARPERARPGLEAFHHRLHPAAHARLVLDFARAADLERLRDLTMGADVVIESSRPRALRQLGIDAEDAVAEGVVWCSITAYGRQERAAMRVGFGDDVAAGAGLVARAHGRPHAVGDAMADPLAGVTAAAAVARALARGRGVLLDVSMHHASLRASRRAAVAHPQNRRHAKETTTPDRGPAG